VHFNPGNELVPLERLDDDDDFISVVLVFGSIVLVMTLIITQTLV
jgi:hypothetical protein